MITGSARVWQRFAVITTITIMLAGLTPASAATLQLGPPPTVGTIVVDSYNCATGDLAFHVPVTNLSFASAGTDPLDDHPLIYDYTVAFSEEGSTFAFGSYNPPAAQSPFTGDVYLTLNARTATGGSGTGVITSIGVSLAVGDAGWYPESSATDSSELAYTVDCDGGSGTEEFIQQLVQLLIRILRDIFVRSSA